MPPVRSDVSQFVRQAALMLAIGWALAFYPLYRAADPALSWAAVVGCSIALLNVIVGCLSAVWAFDKPQTTFLKALFGGMTARLLTMGAAFGVLIHFTDIHVAGLTFSLFGFYVLFQILEVRFLLSHLKGRSAPDDAR